MVFHCIGRDGERRHCCLVVALEIGRPSGLALVLGGALGNVIDRIRFGYVIDFIEVPNYFGFLIGGQWFPAFNVADSAITVGAVLLIIDALFISGRQQAAQT